MNTKVVNHFLSDQGSFSEQAWSGSGQLELLEVKGRRVHLGFSHDRLSSDGGALLLREVDNQIGLLRELSAAISDQRDKRYVSHDISSMLAQRVYQIACGYEDSNDCNELRHDVVMKLCAGRLPVSGDALASQPTMSRLENSVSRTDLLRMAYVLARRFIASYDTEPKAIVLDFDDTNNNTYGNQQLSLFNRYYDEYCYMPLHLYEGFSGKLITTILRPGKRMKHAFLTALVKRVFRYIRQYWPQTLIIVRGDSHFCAAGMINWIEEQPGAYFVTGLNASVRLKKAVEPMVAAAGEAFANHGKEVVRYHRFDYQSTNWANQQQVIAKITANDRGTQIRFIVSNLPLKTRELYEKAYCQRCTMELYIRDHKTYLRSDRSSCHRFEANQFRLLLHSAAYVLIDTLRRQVLKGPLARATMKTIQLKLLKVATKVKELKTKIKIELPIDFPRKAQFETAIRIFQCLNAGP